MQFAPQRRPLPVHFPCNREGNALLIRLGSLMRSCRKLVSGAAWPGHPEFIAQLMVLLGIQVSFQ